MKGSIGRDTISLTIAKMITIFSSIIVMMFLSRNTTLEEYGTYGQIILVITLASALLMLGFPNSINYFMAKAESDEERDEFLLTYYSFTTIISLIIGIILIVIVPYIEVFFRNEHISKYALVLLIFPWCRSTNTSIEKVLVVNNQTSKLQRFKLAHALSLIGAVVIASIMNFHLQGFFILFIIVESFFSLIVYSYIFDITKTFKPTLKLKSIKNILIFSLPIGIASMIGTINIQLDKLMVGRYFDTETLAIYFNASKEIPINILAGSLTAIIMPKLVKLFRQGQIQLGISLWRNAIITSYYIIVFFTILFILFSSEILTILYSEKFASGAPIFSIYALTLLFKMTYFGMVLSSTGNTRPVLYSSIFTLILNMTLNIILIKTIGIIGPAISSLISVATMNFIQLYFSTKILDVKFKDIFPWLKIFNITILSFFVFIVGILLNQFILGIENIGLLLRCSMISIILVGLYTFIFRKDFLYNWKIMNRKGSKF